jgi:16S rRNA (guanine966-N2)-methyltransferase
MSAPTTSTRVDRVRIVGGIARGRPLTAPRGDATRPTTDRVRESMFATLGSRLGNRGWSGVKVLDLFAGSGALGLEALSRGASSAVFVERDRAATRVIAANIERVGLDGGRILARDAARIAGLDPQSAGVSEVPIDVLLCDPPYGEATDRVRGILESLIDHGWLADASEIVIERSARDADSPFPGAVSGRWTIVDQDRRTYGETSLWYGRVSSIA